MKSIQIFSTVAGYLWRILVCAFVYAAGLITSRIVFNALGVFPTRMPEQTDEATAIYYLLIGSVVLSIGLILVARQIRGSLQLRWLILGVFLFVIFGVNNPIESAIFTTTEGALLMIPLLLLPCMLLAGAAAYLFKPEYESGTHPADVSQFFSGRTFGQWSWRCMASVAAFPMVYFAFGILVAPIVAEYYRQGLANLVLPDAGVILSVQFARGFLYLLASIPVLVFWSGTRTQLIIRLGFAFFVLAVIFDVVLAYELPIALRITHSIELLVDSLVYTFLLVKLLVQKNALKPQS